MEKVVRNKNLKNQRIEEILQRARTEFSPKTWDIFEIFVREFYHNVALYDLLEESLDTWVEAVVGAWSFFQERPPGEPKIQVYNQKVKENGVTFQRTVVDIINDDMPFLVDSVSGVLNTAGLAANLIIHPVVRVSRNKKGELLSLCRSTDQTCEGSFESFIRCEANESSKPERLTLIQEETLKVLEDTRVAVMDWAAMRHKVHQALASLQFCPLKKKEHLTLVETEAFLVWLENNHFTFLGYCSYDFIPQTATTRSAKAHSGLGILRSSQRQELQTLFEGVPQTPHNRRFLLESEPLIITKTTQKSTVHRVDFMDCIGVKKFNEEGQVIGIHQFLGLFTSSASNQSARQIPLLRHKIQQVLEKTGLAPQWHDGKALINILETLPREELLQSSIDELCELSFSVLDLQDRQRLSLFIRPDQFGRYLSCFVYIPRDRYDGELRAKIGNFLAQALEGSVSIWNVHLGDLAFARVHYIISLLNQTVLPSYDVAALEKQLFQISLTWHDFLRRSLEMRYEEDMSEIFFQRYSKAFSWGYQDQFSAEEAADDIQEIETVLHQKKINVRVDASLQKGIEEEIGFRVKLYNPLETIFLSDILPVFEQMGLKVRTEIPFKITPKEQETPVWIHFFEVFPEEALTFDIDAIRERFVTTFLKVWSKEIENDGFNRLVLQAGLDWQECAVFRAYAQYLKQLQVPFSQSYMERVLAQYPTFVQGLIKLFHLQFSPQDDGDREEARTDHLTFLETLLDRVSHSDEDRILRRFLNLITSTLRTNFYQQMADGTPKPYLSLKFDCHALDELLPPKPLYEIFVCSPQFEGIHLRGGKVARGGIRWSDRREDYRTELRDLWKTQTVKNAVIIPTGSKGAYIVKKTNLSTREQILAEGTDCYQLFMRGLLDLTDNWVMGKVMSPPDVVRRDSDDPYLVVAADKGTATFSDRANAIAQEYGFWLGDAFASGGSTGYDHKKMGITARGAWKSVQHHFQELSIDISQDPFTVIGVGDMSGDVFGNGMLLSKSLKLVAAFNHQHIFIDPTPDPLTSYTERQRLFDLPRSTWMDYNPILISAGGGVFERSAKRLALSPEIKTFLSIDVNQMTPSELIQHLLKAQVDLLWFGGIGTFVKAQEESSVDVGDRANDSVRINGSDLRARVVGEGANLGFTQKGRIEFALKGGRLNTDALDNSAGVDCSDHEVNIKILFQSLLQKQEITLPERDTLLEKMTEEVSHLVLLNNHWQNKAVSLAYAHAPFLLEEHGRLMRDLENMGKLDRVLEVFPDETELLRRQSLHTGLTRPELCVLLAYGKIHVYQELLLSSLPDEPALTPFLVNYFPKLLSQRFPKAILEHALRRDIIATSVTNLIVDTLGPSLVNEIAKLTGRSVHHVVKAILVVREVISLDSLERSIDDLSVSSHISQQLLWDLNRAVKALVIWFLRQEDMEKEMKGLITHYKSGFETLYSSLHDILPAAYLQKWEEKAAPFLADGIPLSLMNQMMFLEPLSFGGDIIQISIETGLSIEGIASLYYQVGEFFGTRWAWEIAYTFPADNYWQRSAFRAVREEILLVQRSLTRKIVDSAEDKRELTQAFEIWCQTHQEVIITYDRVLQEIRSASSTDLASFVILAQELRHLLFSSTL